jgi:hypothetical protein
MSAKTGRERASTSRAERKKAKIFLRKIFFMAVSSLQKTKNSDTSFLNL